MNATLAARILLPLALVGCTGDKPDTGDTETGADTDTGGATDLCAPRDPSPTTVSETQLNTTYPTPAGGTIADGTYDLVRFEVYAPAAADDHVRARRFVFEGDTVVAVNVDDGAPQPILGGNWSTAGTDLTFAITCPSTGTVTLPYTVSGNELWLFDVDEPNVQVYALQ